MLLFIETKQETNELYDITVFENEQSFRHWASGQLDDSDTNKLLETFTLDDYTFNSQNLKAEIKFREVQ